ncbi:hypothetical protein GX48_02691 [Paracoccidioides brasiliensis]|nr:hypothetical protein GX48_02691 [Paracoccidioides brasiliensis]
MIGNEVSAVQQAFNKLFTTLTPDQIQDFQQFLQQVNTANNAANNAANNTVNVAPSNTTSNIFGNTSGNALSNVPNNVNNVAATMPSVGHAPASLPNTSLSASMTMAAPMAVRASAPSQVTAPRAAHMTSRARPNSKSRTQASRGKRGRGNGKLRPLNSFIAFRSFYSTVFPDLSQKIKSGLLRHLWTSDPFKAKWAILAKAYSIIRDSHAGQVNLESFLTLNGPLIGIVGPKDYLRVMGLQLDVNMDKQFSVMKTNPLIGPTQGDLTTNLSVDDLVAHCYQVGYVAGAIYPNNGNQGVGVAMAVAAQPNHAHFPQTLGLPQPMIQNPDPVLGGRSTDINNDSTNTSGIGSEADNDQTSIQDNGVLPIEVPYYTVENINQEIRIAMNEIPIDIEGTNYFAIFNPELRNSVFSYQPYRVQSDFDPYDITEYLDI